MKKGKVLVFGGTVEGRCLTERLLSAGYQVLYSVATDYGRELLEQQEGLCVLKGRLNRQQMTELFQGRSPELVIDATHPYATEVSENILLAAEACRLPHYRLLRQREQAEGVLWADNPQKAVELLAGLKGNILLTTGSKDLSAFTALSDYAQRLWVRILPSISSLELALQAGIPAKQIICMQGPFTTELNVAMLRQTDCKILVSKDSGRAGGFLEKLEAAQQLGATLLVISRPREERGYGLEELLALLQAETKAR